MADVSFAGRVQRRVAGLACLLCAVASPAAAGPASLPAAGDYAYGWPVRVTAPADVYELELPLEVYRSALDPLLRDLAVYDADGEPVPRYLRPPAAARQPPALSLALAPIPVWAAPGQPAGDVRLSVQRRDGSTELRLESGEPAVAGRTLAAYVADLRALDRPPHALELGWEAQGEPLLMPVEVAGSDDLEHWYPLGAGTVARLVQGDARIEQRRIELSGRKAAYLRVTWQGAPPAWRLATLIVHYRESALAPPALQQLTLRPTGRDPADRGYLFDAGGELAVQQFALALPSDNVVIRANVYAWNRLARRWDAAHAGLFYHLRRDGADVQGEPVRFEARRARQWKVVVERGRPELDLALRLGWRPDRLVFVAQGRAPWQVAAGSASDREQGYPQARQFAEPEIAGLLQQAGRVGTATLLARRELGGAAKLTRPQAPPWGRWLLWLGLAGGVAVVAWMVQRLLRQLRASG